MPDVSSVVPPKTTSEWKQPSSRPAEINALVLGVDRYNPSNVALLEEYLDAQIRDGQHDLFANLAILKLYQFNPPMSNPRISTNILLLALTSPLTLSLTSQDFPLCLSLALDRPPTALLSLGNDNDDDDDEEESSGRDDLGLVVPFLRECWGLMRECRFRAFWKLWTEGEGEGAELIRTEYAPNHPHLLTSLRTLFSSQISTTFTAIDLPRLQKWLNFSSSEEVEGWVKGVDGWSLDGQVVKIENNGDNDVKPGVVREEVKLSQLTKLIAAAAY